MEEDWSTLRTIKVPKETITNQANDKTPLELYLESVVKAKTVKIPKMI